MFVIQSTVCYHFDDVIESSDGLCRLTDIHIFRKSCIFPRGAMADLTRSSFHVFVVDDENVICTTIAMILRSTGIDAVPFNHPLDALEAARLRPPDLLLTDVVMPDLNGIELALLVTKLCPDCKVLLFSGQASTVDLLEAATEAGHKFEILAKPIHPTDLLAQIRKFAPESLSA